MPMLNINKAEKFFWQLAYENQVYIAKIVRKNVMSLTFQVFFYMESECLCSNIVPL